MTRSEYPEPPEPAAVEATHNADTLVGSAAAPAVSDPDEDVTGAMLEPTPVQPGIAELRVVARDEYRIDAPFARGGIGRILRATSRYLHRPVALKELLTPNRSAEQRFVREAMLTARLQHPGIVPIYEAGRWPSGEPFYAMKLVAGHSLADRIAATTSLDQRLALLPHAAALAEAMAYAHSQRIIHRDLKPENILVGDYGETVVIDWGLAKDLDAPEEATPAPAAPSDDAVDSLGILTVVGAVMGTPMYMPPEQASGEAVDERADVYSIGAILYHLIAGVPPFAGAGVMEILLTVTGAGPPAIESVQPGIPRELATIIRKAMASRPAERYPSARELAEDLRRFGAGQLVAAHHYSRGERLRRLLRRYRAPLAVGMAGLLLLAFVGTISVLRVVSARNAAQNARIDAEHHADELAFEQAREAAPKSPNRALELLAGLHDQRAWQRMRTIAADAHAHGLGVELRGHLAALSRIEFSPDSRRLVTTSDDCSARLWDLEQRTSQVLLGHSDEVWRAAFSPDGRLLATSSRDASVRVWDVSTGAALQELRAHTLGVRRVIFTADGAQLVSGGDDNRLLRWDLATGAAEELAHCLAGSLVGDARRVACIDADFRGVTVHDLNDGTAFHLPHPESVIERIEVVAGRDELLLLADGRLLRWAWREAELTVIGEAKGKQRALVSSPDGRTVAFTGPANTIELWREDVLMRSLAAVGGAPRRLQFTPDGRHLLAVGGDTRVHIFGVDDDSHRALAAFEDSASAIAASPDGLLLAAAGADGSALVWPLAGLQEHRLGGVTTAAAIDVAQSLVHTGDADGAIHTWALDAPHQGERLRTIRPRVAAVSAIAALNTQGRLLVSSVDGDVALIDRDGHRLATMGPLARGAIRLTISPDDRYAAGHLSAPDGEVHVWDLATRARRRLFAADNVKVVWLDDHTLAATDESPKVLAHDLAAGTTSVLIADSLRLVAIAQSEDRRYLLAAGQSHIVHVLDRDSGHAHEIPITNVSKISDLATVPGTTQVLVVSDRNRVELWDYLLAMKIHDLIGPDAPPNVVAATPGGAAILVQSEDLRVRLWDVVGGEGRELGLLPETIGGTLYTNAGQVVATTLTGAYVWSDELPRTEAAFRGWLRSQQEALVFDAEAPTARPPCRSLGDVVPDEPRAP